MRHRATQKILAAVAVCLTGVALLLSMTATAARGPKTEHNVFVAFGFHVNLYHSFRGDGVDESGFGKDLRVIRHIVKTLDGFNSRGVPVKGVWDFDNLFSLQERLPRHAPDIIRDIQRRVKSGADEVILMSYNNGLTSAMTRQELTDTMRWAVTNPWGSGVADLFQRYSPIVRPQEMMTTPGSFALYREQGIQAVALYYSATPFDAFRVFSRPLNRTEAYNPILYHNPATGEEMTIIPTYHIGDLMENVSLRNWTTKLHRLQQEGEIDRDVLIFINYDGDSDFWSGLDLRWPLDQLPNTGGLGALIEEVKDIDYVRFTTLQDYLRDHPPAGRVYFGQDTADGSFDGYNSWAEKASSRQYWTRIERHRRLHETAVRYLAPQNALPADTELQALLDNYYLKRMRALSTTNFGMATPFLAPDRETALQTLFAELDADAGRIEAILRRRALAALPGPPTPSSLPEGHHWLDTVLLLNQDEGSGGGSRRFLDLTLEAADLRNRRILLTKTDGRTLAATTIHWIEPEPGGRRRLKLFLPGPQRLEDGCYYVISAPAETNDSSFIHPSSRRLANAQLEVRFDPNGRIQGVFQNGVRKLEAGSLSPYLRHRNEINHPAKMEVIQLKNGGDTASARVVGTWRGPPGPTTIPGEMDYQFTLVAGLPYLFVHGRLQYPRTRERDIFRADAPSLARSMDADWQEVAPAELRFAHAADVENPLRILKQNYLGVRSDYAADYFRHAPANLSLDDINNHITAAYFGLVADGQGMAVAMDTHVAANFAFAPVKMRFDPIGSRFSVQANPFGTYHGDQYRHPTWGNRQGYEMTVLAGEQFHSAGPTYNGTSSAFELMLAFFEGEAIPEPMETDLLHFARPPVVVSLLRRPASPPDKQRQHGPSLLEAVNTDIGVYFRWSAAGSETACYRLSCGRRPGVYDQVFETTETRFMVRDRVDGDASADGHPRYAVVNALAADGTALGESEEIAVSRNAPVRQSRQPHLSFPFQLKVLWANLSAYLKRQAI